MTQRFYVTTPIYYVNDKPHIGHAYCTVLADAAARWHRLLGYQSYFLTGTDEHGQKVQEAAQKRGISPQVHVDELHLAFKSLWPELKCAPNQFIRTTEPRHKAVVQAALQKLFDAGLIVSREFEGWYCTPEERFWTEKELVGDACPSCGRPVSRLAEKNYFFLMSRYQQRLIDALNSGRIKVFPANRANEVLGFLDKPLQDLCISRPKSRLAWGIELPFDGDFVTYVWFDALLNYASGIGFLNATPPSDAQFPNPELSAEENFKLWWPNIAHFLGKDILTTHTVYWPTMLMGLEEALGLPENSLVPGRFVVTGWWLLDNAKMSKSLGNVVSPLSMKDKYGPEVLRYFLLREMAVGQDANFSEEAVLRRNNADLANDLGNLLQRVSALAAKNWDGKVPESTPLQTPSTELAMGLVARLLGRNPDLASISEANRSAVTQVEAIADSVAQFRLHKALADTMMVVGALNSMISLDKPFSLVKTDKALAGGIVYAVLEGLRIVAHLLEPALPDTAREILKRIGWSGELLTLDKLQWGQLPAGAPLVEGPALFPKHEIVAQVADLKPDVKADVPLVPELAASDSSGEAGHKPAEIKPEVTIDQFGTADLRVGRVLVCEKVPKSSKLLRLEVDIGEAKPRQILSGIAESFAPEDLVNKEILLIANLPPRKMMGLESHGMVLVADDGQGKRVLLRPERDVPAGSSVQ